MSSVPKIIGYTTGVYDLFHIGHLNLLRRAKESCDFLIVGVSTDELALQTKGSLPAISYKERAEIVSAIRYVDTVIPQLNYDKFARWTELNFDKIFVGSDWKGTERWIELEQQFSKVSVEVVYFPYTESTSSSFLKSFLQSKTL